MKRGIDKIEKNEDEEDNTSSQESSKKKQRSDDAPVFNALKRKYKEDQSQDDFNEEKCLKKKPRCDDTETSSSSEESRGRKRRYDDAELESEDESSEDSFKKQCFSGDLTLEDMPYLETLLKTKPFSEIRVNRLINFNQVFSDGTTPLWWMTLAALLGRNQALEVLLQHIPLVDLDLEATNLSETQFHGLSVKMLLHFLNKMDAGEEIFPHRFYQGIFCNNIKLLDISFYPSHYNGLSPLHWAIELNRFEIMTHLLSLNLPLNEICDQLTPLHRAIQLGNQPMVELLSQSGANIESKYNGMTPLHFAIFKKQYAIALFLVESGANLESQDNNRRTPLKRLLQAPSPSFEKSFLISTLKEKQDTSVDSLCAQFKKFKL